jgi:hypothetical protein
MNNTEQIEVCNLEPSTNRAWDIEVIDCRARNYDHLIEKLIDLIDSHIDVNEWEGELNIKLEFSKLSAQELEDIYEESK